MADALQISRPAVRKMSKEKTFEMQMDCAPVDKQIAELRGLLDRLPEGVRDSFLDRVANLGDFGLQTETLPADRTGRIVLRFRSAALAELCAAAVRAADGDRS